MQNLADLSKYQELRKRIVQNEELSDAEWDLFFELEMKYKEIRQAKQTWENVFHNSVLLPEQTKPTKVRKHFSLSKLVYSFKPILTRKYQYAYAGLFVFFIIGFISYSTKRFIVEPDVSVISQNEKIQQELSSPVEEKLDITNNDQDLIVYSENPYLESYISDAVRSAPNTVEMISPQPSLRYQLKNGADSLTLSFNCLIKTNENLQGNIFLKIFSNKMEEYSNDLPLIKEELELEVHESGLFFSKQIRHHIKRGLYYFTIEDTKNEEIFYLNKFYIY